MATITRKSAVFYNSIDPTSVISAVLVKIKYPTTEFYNIAGLTAGQITTLIGTLTATSYHDIWLVCDKVSSNFTVGSAVAFLTSGNVTALGNKLIAISPPQDPVPDATIKDFSAQTDGGKLRVQNVFEEAFPTKSVARMARLLSKYQLSMGDTALALKLYLGLRAKTVGLDNITYLQSLISCIDPSNRLNAPDSVAEAYPQGIDEINAIISNGSIVEDFVTITAVSLPEGTPVVV